MTGTVHTFTTIHVGVDHTPSPYAVIIVDVSGGRRTAARVEGDVSWLRIGMTVKCEARDGVTYATPSID